MRRKGLLIATMTCTLAFGTAAAAEAKPQDAKAKHCTKKDKKLRCETSGGPVISGTCPAGFEPATVIQLGPGAEAGDLNGNGFLCWSSVQGTLDDTP